MPGIDEKESSIRLRRARYTFWAIIAPEAVIFWAMRQLYGAHTVKKELHDQLQLDWSMTHSHFLQMGGFVLCKGKEKIGILSYQHLKSLVKGRKIEFPTIRKEEIEDRSKGTTFSKAIVTIQIVWFVIQCIARHVQGLAITKLELATLALGVLNFVMYICWLGKPLDVRFQVPVYLLEAPKSETETEDAIGDGLFSSSRQGIVDSQGITEPLGPGALMSANNPTHKSHWSKAAISWIFEDLKAMVITDENQFPADSELAPCLFGDRIPAFYALPIDEETDCRISAAVAIMGIIFGGIHCTAWFFTFPSFTGLMVWRVCSAAIAGIAGIGLLAAIFQTISVYTHSESFLHAFAGLLKDVSVLLLIICALVYVLARLALLIVAFGTLKGLRPEALAAVKWVTFLPHI